MNITTPPLGRGIDFCVSGPRCARADLQLPQKAEVARQIVFSECGNADAKGVRRWRTFYGGKKADANGVSESF